MKRDDFEAWMRQELAAVESALETLVPADTPVARRCAAGVFSLPVHPYLTSADIDHIVGSVRRAVRA